MGGPISTDGEEDVIQALGAHVTEARVEYLAGSALMFHARSCASNFDWHNNNRSMITLRCLHCRSESDEKRGKREVIEENVRHLQDLMLKLKNKRQDPVVGRKEQRSSFR